MPWQRNLLPVLLFALGIPVISQSWCPPGATWLYFTSGSVGSSTTLNFVGDTLVDGFSGQRIMQSNTLAIPWNPDSIIMFGGPDIVTRTEPGIVLWWAPEVQEWDTLYWFNAEPGDKWSPGWEKHYPWLESCLDSAYLQVVDTGTMVVDGLPLRTLIVERVAGSDVDHTFTIMERVGNTQEYFFPYPPGICFVNEALMTFSCYGDDEIRYPPSSTPCSLTLGVREANAIQLGLMPNPTDGLLYVRLPEGDRAFSVWAADGRRVEVAGTPTAQGLQLDATGLAPGVYVLRTASGQVRFVKR